MDFDPGFHEEMYDEGFEDGYEEAQEELEDVREEDYGNAEPEYDDDGNVIAVVTAAGFGYHMAQDEIEERKLAEDLLREKEEKIEKIPLHARHSSIKGGSPFERWARDVQAGRKTMDDPLEFTPEEEDKILAKEVVEE